jgi:hypothetical protein
MVLSCGITAFPSRPHRYMDRASNSGERQAAGARPSPAARARMGVDGHGHSRLARRERERGRERAQEGDFAGDPAANCAAPAPRSRSVRSRRPGAGIY